MTPEGTNCRTGAHFPTQRLGRTSQRSMPGSKRSKTFSTVSPSRPALDQQLMTYIQPGFRLGATILCCGEGIAQVETLNEFHDDKLSILSGEPSPLKGRTHTQPVRTIRMQAVRHKYSGNVLVQGTTNTTYSNLTICKVLIIL
jgi:hypothetical protein